MLIPPLIATVSSSLKSSALIGGVAMSVTIWAQNIPSTDSISFDRAIREGGLLAIVVLLLAFMRRDKGWEVAFWKGQSERMETLITNNTVALTKMEGSLAQNTVVMHQAKNIMARQLREPDHRDEDA